MSADSYRRAVMRRPGRTFDDTHIAKRKMLFTGGGFQKLPRSPSIFCSSQISLYRMVSHLLRAEEAAQATSFHR